MLPEIPEIENDDTCSHHDVAVAASEANGRGDITSISGLPRKKRARRWHVTFGNPALETYDGTIVTLHPRSFKKQEEGAIAHKNDSDEDYDDDDSSVSSSDDSFSSCSSLGTAVDGKTFEFDRTGGAQRIVVMANVPPHQVPDGVLNLVRSHRPFIEHIRILIGLSKSEEEEYRRRRRELRNLPRSNINAKHEDNNDKDQCMRRSRSQTWACEEEHAGRSDVDTYVNITGPFGGESTSKLNENEAFNQSKFGNTRESRSTSLDISHYPYYVNSIGAGKGCDVNSDNLTAGFGDEKENDGDSKNYHILFVLDSEESALTFVSDLHHRPYTSLDESETCSIYHAGHVRGENGVSLLGPFFASSRSSANNTSSGNDTSHPSSPSAKDEHQCPVCLEKMIAPSTRPSVAAASDESAAILTTVCNHSFHIDCLARWQDSPCPVCRYDHSGLNESLSRCHVCATTVRNYVCLICGMISCSNGPLALTCSPRSSSDGTEHLPPQAPSRLGHALQHYEESLHAYALDTETQHVWDFVGGGYVHRLLQNAEDGKLVEGIDPRVLEEERIFNQLGGEAPSTPLSALERSTIPTYSSSAEDDEATHRKLEGYAGQYYTLLKSQLEQQRIYYQGQLEAIRREHENATINERQSTANLISALKQERNQLEQRCTTLRRKHKKVSDDAIFLENMNKSLEADKLAFRKQIAEAQAELTETKELTQQLLTPLEEKVSSLMLQLEHGISGGGGWDDSKPAAS